MKKIILIILLFYATIVNAKDKYYVYKDADGNYCTCINNPSCGCEGKLVNTVRVAIKIPIENPIIKANQFVLHKLDKIELKEMEELGLKNCKKYIIMNKYFELIIYTSDLKNIDEKMLKKIMQNKKLKYEL